MKFSHVALLGAAGLGAAQRHAHNHVHRHPVRHASPLEGRDAVVVTTTAPDAVVTVYELNGDHIPVGDVEAGLRDGRYVLIETTTAKPTTSTIPSTSSTPTPTPTVDAAKFFEKSSSSETPTSTYVAPTTSSTPKPAPTVAPAPAKSPSSSSGAGNINADFPSGTIKCSEFPSAYGAVAAEWLGLRGWTGIQKLPDFTFGVDSLISYIETGISGDGGCVAKSTCSYACPAGYQKSQWTEAQGSTSESIGGLYCNPNGYLELSNTNFTTICIKGTGGVEVTNNLDENVCVCRTDYPGTESETIALNTLPGQTYELTCPDANTYYQWKSPSGQVLPTSAQYYINPQGLPPSKACTWGDAGSNCGNWAPVNAGVGKGADGNIYISLFPNTPTNPDGTLDYSIAITGDVSGKCSYSGGTYFMNGAKSATGCTVSYDAFEGLCADLTAIRLVLTQVVLLPLNSTNLKCIGDLILLGVFASFH
jgi:hypothetical protein